MMINLLCRGEVESERTNLYWIEVREDGRTWISESRVRRNDWSRVRACTRRWKCRQSSFTGLTCSRLNGEWALALIRLSVDIRRRLNWWWWRVTRSCRLLSECTQSFRCLYNRNVQWNNEERENESMANLLGERVRTRKSRCRIGFKSNWIDVAMFGMNEMCETSLRIAKIVHSGILTHRSHRHQRTIGMEINTRQWWHRYWSSTEFYSTQLCKWTRKRCVTFVGQHRSNREIHPFPLWPERLRGEEKRLNQLLVLCENESRWSILSIDNSTRREDHRSMSCPIILYVETIESKKLHPTERETWYTRPQSSWRCHTLLPCFIVNAAKLCFVNWL